MKSHTLNIYPLEKSPRHPPGAFFINAFIHDFLYGFCIFHGGQPRGPIFKNAYFSGFLALFSPRVNANAWVRVPQMAPPKTPQPQGLRGFFIFLYMVLCLTLKNCPENLKNSIDYTPIIVYTISIKGKEGQTNDT